MGPGQRLEFTSITGEHLNTGRIEVIGGEIEFAAVLTNESLIAGRDATLRFGSRLDNNGSLALTIGISDILGDVNNRPGGQIVVSGGSTVTFYDDVTNDMGSAFQVSAAGTLTSTAVFFGSLSGTGISGTGNVFMEGDMLPGASPGVMNFGGNLALGPLATTQIELAGTTAGTTYDQVNVAGDLSLGGELDVLLTNGFLPGTPDPSFGGDGDTFNIMSAGSIGGSFSTVTGLDYDNASETGRELRLSQTSTDVTLTAFQAAYGDGNMDRQLDSTDLFAILGAGKFNNPKLGPATWLEGDFSGDDLVDSTDLFLILGTGKYNQGPYATSAQAAALAAVPEPSSFALAALSLTVLLMFASRRRATIVE